MTGNNASSSLDLQLSLRGPGIPGNESAESSGQTIPAGTDLPQQELVKRCLDIVNDYRASKGSKYEAFYIISQVIKEYLREDSQEDPTVIAAPYFTMLEHCESEQARAAQQPRDDVD